ncbi:hypothetical protein ACFOOK_27410 [Micromonospora krabiensis]|uniref:tRNA nuclease CdiA C-terminal domain-containing protein n=1 Tax=Micromonospora krabiensis TaxID=307121 RepID=A0A1C3N548_9ACTN|nr:hypothetical protein [Micromonospora krabiensis]SBV27704.1 hypothetical protein GA0070620_3230 [Micromonospora krabiensis]
MPTGTPTRISPNEDVRERRSLELENQCAARLAAQGYRVQQNPTQQQLAEARRSTGDLGDPRKSPDYLIEGHIFDCYSPTRPVPPRAVWSAVSKKIDKLQVQRVVLNLEDWRGDLRDLQRQFDDWPVEGLKELVAVTRNGRIVQIVRPT